MGHVKRHIEISGGEDLILMFLILERNTGRGRECKCRQLWRGVGDK